MAIIRGHVKCYIQKQDHQKSHTLTSVIMEFTFGILWKEIYLLNSFINSFINGIGLTEANLLIHLLNNDDTYDDNEVYT